MTFVDAINVKVIYSLRLSPDSSQVLFTQSVEMYRGLKANGVPTELVIFPRSGHGPRELRHRLYKWNKEFQWLEKYIMGREFEFEKPPATEDKDKKQ